MIERDYTVHTAHRIFFVLKNKKKKDVRNRFYFVGLAKNVIKCFSSSLVLLLNVDQNYNNCHDAVSTTRLFDKMGFKGLVQNTLTHTAIISGLSKAGKSNEAFV